MTVVLEVVVVVLFLAILAVFLIARWGASLDLGDLE